MAVGGIKGGKEDLYGLMAEGLDSDNNPNADPIKRLEKAGGIAGSLGEFGKASGGGGGGGGGLFGGGGGGLLGGIMNIAKMVLSVVCPAAGIALNLVSGLMNSQGGGGGGGGGMGQDILGSVANGVLGGALGG